MTYAHFQSFLGAGAPVTGVPLHQLVLTTDEVDRLHENASTLLTLMDTPMGETPAHVIERLRRVVQAARQGIWGDFWCELSRLDSVKGAEYRGFREMWRQLGKSYERFVPEARARLVGYRPRLPDISELLLDDAQLKAVDRSFDGHYRIKASAGAGKTVVLAARAVRNLLEPAARTMVVSPSDPLLSDIVEAVQRNLESQPGDRFLAFSLTALADDWRRYVTHQRHRDDVVRAAAGFSRRRRARWSGGRCGTRRMPGGR